VNFTQRREERQKAPKNTALPALLLPAHDFLMRRFRQARHAFRFGFGLTGYSAGFISVVLMHLFLSFVKIEFVYARRSDFESLDVPCLISHDCSFPGSPDYINLCR
jgi:hypothetical protein